MVQVGEAAANRVVVDVGSSMSGDIANGYELGEVVTGSSSSGMPSPAQSILAIRERHGHAALLVLAGCNKYDLIYIIDQIPSSTSSN
jgi:hypothetical protein